MLFFKFALLESMPNFYMAVDVYGVWDDQGYQVQCDWISPHCFVGSYIYFSQLEIHIFSVIPPLSIFFSTV